MPIPDKMESCKAGKAQRKHPCSENLNALRTAKKAGQMRPSPRFAGRGWSTASNLEGWIVGISRSVRSPIGPNHIKPLPDTRPDRTAVRTRHQFGGFREHKALSVAKNMNMDEIELRNIFTHSFWRRIIIILARLAAQGGSTVYIM